jgi:hypothetical protein
MWETSIHCKNSPRANVIKLFTVVIYKFVLIRPETSQSKDLSGAPLYGRQLDLCKNIRLGWKGLPRTNALAYYENS